MITNIPHEAYDLQDKLVRYRHDLHAMPELGLHLPATSAYVKDKLIGLGITPASVGEYGLTFTLGNAGPAGTVLLRADMDGLPIREETGLPYVSCNGNMHACGHDMHTAMLLGAAELLKDHEDELKGTAKFLFQPGEETMEGATDALVHGILKDPDVDAAMMIHVMTGMPLPHGLFVASSTSGVISASSDWFEIIIHGKGTHSAMAGNNGNPLETAAKLYLELQNAGNRFGSPEDPVIIGVGMIQGGSTNNVMPETALLKGTARTFSSDMRDQVLAGIRELSAKIAAQYGTSAEVCFTRGCPSAVTDHDLNQQLIRTITNCYGPSSFMDIERLIPGGRLPGSEDFSFITHEVPSTLAFLAAGCSDEGYVHPAHNPKTAYTDEVLHRGAAVYASFAIDWLNSTTIYE